MGSSKELSPHPMTMDPDKEPKPMHKIYAQCMGAQLGVPPSTKGGRRGVGLSRPSLMCLGSDSVLGPTFTFDRLDHLAQAQHL